MMTQPTPSYNLTHLQQLEAESIYIIREVVAECTHPVMLYSIGKDSAVMVHLARKAFAPGKLPFPLLHVDTTFKFPEMYAFRDRFTKQIGAELIVFRHEEALRSIGPDPANWNCTLCSNLLKTQALIKALRHYGFDAAIGGARRDEEKSRAKERVFSFRDQQMQWNPRDQRPELWCLYNTLHNPGESFRIFPLSNWTELDIWTYIWQENIPIVSLYYAREREVIKRDGLLLLKTDLVQPRKGEEVIKLMCRYRTLGCQLCTGAIPSQATTLLEIVAETMLTDQSERHNRAVDQESGDSSMETKKKEGYF